MKDVVSYWFRLNPNFLIIVLKSLDKIRLSIFPASAISFNVLGILFSLHAAYSAAETKETIVSCAGRPNGSFRGRALRCGARRADAAGSGGRARRHRGFRDGARGGPGLRYAGDLTRDGWRRRVLFSRGFGGARRLGPRRRLGSGNGSLQRSGITGGSATVGAELLVGQLSPILRRCVDPDLRTRLILHEGARPGTSPWSRCVIALTTGSSWSVTEPSQLLSTSRGLRASTVPGASFGCATWVSHRRVPLSWLRAGSVSFAWSLSVTTGCRRTRPGRRRWRARTAWGDPPGSDAKVRSVEGLPSCRWSIRSGVGLNFRWRVVDRGCGGQVIDYCRS